MKERAAAFVDIAEVMFTLSSGEERWHEAIIPVNRQRDNRRRKRLLLGTSDTGYDSRCPGLGKKEADCSREEPGLKARGCAHANTAVIFSIVRLPGVKIISQDVV